MVILFTQGIKANMKYLYSNMTEEKFNICKNKDKYKRVIFAIAFLHSLLNGRKLFGPYGWNMEYNFLNNDFEVSKLVAVIKCRRLLIFPFFTVMRNIHGQIFR